VVSANTLTDGVPKVSKGYSEGLCHFWHPRHFRVFESRTSGHRCRAEGNSAQERPWLEALKDLEEGTNEGEKGRTNAVLSSVDETSKFLDQQGAKSAKSPSDVLLSLLALPRIGTYSALQRG
jgi:hypothetical protein